MIMNRKLPLYGTALLSVVMSMSSCGDDKPQGPTEPDSIKRCVLLYAVASNNLYENLLSDKDEILEAARDMDLTGLSMMVYQVTRNDSARLLQLRRGRDGVCEFISVKSYDKDIYSTDPRRIGAVIEDVRALTNANNYGLIFWSHGTGIDPSFSTHDTRSDCDEMVFSETRHSFYSFGSDNNPEKDKGYYDEIDIDELADAIPDGVFDFIWFDACYMSGIETAYELRDKCDTFVAYPTEVYTPGMPYNLTIPYILKETPDLKSAASEFFTYYSDHPSSSYRVATIAVMDMTKIEIVAEYCNRAYSGFSKAPSSSGLQTYSRGKFGPFYDFGQYTRRVMEMNPTDMTSEDFERLMDEFVIYKSATDYDFNGRPISADNYSGVSCFRFSESDSSEKAQYYHTLDWYKRVYPKVELE